MTRIAILGAGSVVFSKNVIADLLWHEALKGCELRLMDIDPERLSTALALGNQINAALGSGARITATRQRRKALDGADFVICTIGVGGFAATRDDLEIPLRHGLKQTVGDTLGVGGIFRAARSVPEVLRICADMEALCPSALLLNYTNPMAMHCLAIERASAIRHVGICHGVQNSARTMRMLIALMDGGVSLNTIRRHLDRPSGSAERLREWLEWWAMGEDRQLAYTCAGINHMAFFLRYESAGKDLYPALRRAAALPQIRELDPVRVELFRRLGYFMTETSGHMAEYVPYFLKSDAEISDCRLKVNSYLRTCRDQDAAYRGLARDMKAGRPAIRLPYTPSNEYASRIVNAIVTGAPFVFNGNVHNRGGALISNLPGDACVEVPCVADWRGVTPMSIGELPPQCAALIRPNISVQDLAVRGVLEGRRDRICQAAMMDPNTASQLGIPGIWRLCEAMFKAHARRLPRNLK